MNLMADSLFDSSVGTGWAESRWEGVEGGQVHGEGGGDHEQTTEPLHTAIHECWSRWGKEGVTGLI